MNNEIMLKQDLVDALKWALDQIEDDLDPDHQAALAEAKRIAEEAEESVSEPGPVLSEQEEVVILSMNNWGSNKTASLSTGQGIVYDQETNCTVALTYCGRTSTPHYLIIQDLPSLLKANLRYLNTNSPEARKEIEQILRDAAQVLIEAKQ